MTRATDTAGHTTPACSLTPDELPGRISRWRALDAHALRRHVEPGHVVTTYPNRPDVAARLQLLIAAEQDCCAFLQFDVRQRGGVVDVELRYPAEFAAMLGTVLGGHVPAQA